MSHYFLGPEYVGAPSKHGSQKIPEDEMGGGLE